MGSEPGGSGVAALSPDSGWGRRTREGQGLGAQGGAAAGQLSARAPSCAPRGLLRGGWGAGRAAPAATGSGGADWSGAAGLRERGSLVQSGPRPGSSPGPRTAPGSPTPDGKFGAGLDGGRCCGIGFPCRGPPAARPLRWGGGLSWKARLLSRAAQSPAGALALQPRGRRPRPAAWGGQGWGARRRESAPLYTPPPPGLLRGGAVPAEPWSAPRGPARAWGKGPREGWGCVGGRGCW